MRFDIVWSIFCLVLIAALLGWAVPWAERWHARTPSQPAWQQGMWQLQERALDCALPIVQELAAKQPDCVVTTRADCSELPGMRLSSLTAKELAGRLKIRAAAIPGLEKIVVREEQTPAERKDAALDLKLIGFEPTADGDLVTLSVSVLVDGRAVANQEIQATCPPGGRGWFVRPKAPSQGSRMTAGLLCVAGILMLLRGAQNTYLNDKPGAKWMASGAAAMATGLVLLLVPSVPPATTALSLARQQIGLAVDTSDAVLFPPMPGSSRPDHSPGNLNSLAAFIAQCAEDIRNTSVKGEENTPESTFSSWLATLWQRLAAPVRTTRRLRSDSGIEIYTDLPLWQQETTNRQCRSVPLADLRETLSYGHRSQGPGIFLPWTPVGNSPMEYLIVNFATGEPASSRQALELQGQSTQVRGGKPKNVQVLTVMLPSVPRSADSLQFEESRLKNLACFSDAILSIGNSSLASVNGAEVTESVPLFDTGRLQWMARDQWLAPSDLDAARTALFQCDQASILAAAKRVARQARGRVQMDDAPVFVHDPLLIRFLVLYLSLLAGMIALLREITRLSHTQICSQSWPLIALASLGVALTGAGVVLFMADNVAGLTSGSDPELVLWAILMIWYAYLFLPLLVGRGAGYLSAPRRRLKTDWVVYLLGAGVVIPMLATIVGMGLMWWLDLSWHNAVIRTCMSLALTGASALAVLVPCFAMSRFARGHRRPIVILGLIGFVLLALVPWTNRLPLHGITALHAGAAAMVAALIAMALQWVGVEKRNQTGKGAGWGNVQDRPGHAPEWIVFLFWLAPATLVWTLTPCFAWTRAGNWLPVDPAGFLWRAILVGLPLGLLVWLLSGWFARHSHTYR